MAGGLVLSLLTAAPALADHETDGSHRRGDRPSAVGVDSRSRTYVGFVDGAGLARFTAAGKRLRPWRLPDAGPVTALDVTAHDRVWITDGRTARLIGRDGVEERSFEHGPAEGCPNTRGQRSGRYGGIESWRRLVFVANRCEKSLQVFRRSGDLVATIALPGRGHPRGLAYDPGDRDRRSRLYVAFPDRGRLLVFGGGTWTDDEEPLRRLRVREAGRGWHRPAPAGVAVDRFGQVVVTDLTNHAVHLFDGRRGLTRYRVLGHPPRPGDKAGALRRPNALAQHAQDGTRDAGALLLADAKNRRVQRWNTYGWTYWSHRVRFPRAEDSP